MRSLLFSLLIIVVSFSFPPSLNKDFEQALRNGNVKKMIQYFDTRLTLELLSVRGIYSKEQSEIILNDFFAVNKPLILEKISQQSGSNTYTYIYLLKTSKGKSFYVHYKFQKISESFKIINFSIMPAE